MTTTSATFRLSPAMNTWAGIMSDVAHEWTNVCGASATSADVARRWGLDLRACERVLDELVVRGVLSQSADGRYRYAAHDWRGDDCCAPGWTPFTQM